MIRVLEAKMYKEPLLELGREMSREKKNQG